MTTPCARCSAGIGWQCRRKARASSCTTSTAKTVADPGVAGWHLIRQSYVCHGSVTDCLALLECPADGPSFVSRTSEPAMTLKSEQLRQRVEFDLADSLDEEYEMELDDDRLDKLLSETADHQRDEGMDRRIYFKELFRLQGELVKLQDWVAHHKKKIVVIFEGRDSAGKGGVIKRITQRLNPRICRVAALPAPNERERTQW